MGGHRVQGPWHLRVASGPGELLQATGPPKL